MDTWAPASEDVRSFANLFAALRVTVPQNHTTSTKTTMPTEANIELTGRSFFDIHRLDLSQLKINNQYTRQSAKNLLCNYGPVPLSQYPNWTSARLSRELPASIASERNAQQFFTLALLDPTLAAATFLYASYRQPASYQQCYPGGHWTHFDISSHGPTGRSDIGILKRLDVIDGLTQRAVVQFECKPAYVCRSVGSDTGLTRSVLLNLGEWFELRSGNISMDPPGTTADTRPNGDIHWYPQSWQQKLQKFLFQVCIPIALNFPLRLIHFRRLGIKCSWENAVTAFFARRKNLFFAIASITACIYHLCTRLRQIQMKNDKIPWSTSHFSSAMPWMNVIQLGINIHLLGNRSFLEHRS